MPRNSVRSSDPQKIVRFPFRTISGTTFSNSAATTVASLNLSAANLGARIAAAAPDFEFFRISKLRAYTYSDVVGPVYVGTSTFTPPACSIAIAFDPSDSSDTTAPTTFGQMSQYAHAKFGSAYSMLRIAMGPRDLWQATPTKWYNTTSTGSPPALSLSAGVVYIANNNAIGSISGVQNQFLVTEGEVEFMGPVTPALSRVAASAIPMKSHVQEQDWKQLETDADHPSPLGTVGDIEEICGAPALLIGQRSSSWASEHPGRCLGVQGTSCLAAASKQTFASKVGNQGPAPR